PQSEQFPDFLTALGEQAWSKIGGQYIERTQNYRSGAARFIDKNPNNFTYVGLLHLAMPNAKIINARRHPLDSCFGTYKQLFASGQPFSYDLTELGEYYIQYQRLMDHWHEILPGKVLDVNYEDVVQDLDGQVRRLLEYCELPIEEACFKFHETERAVKTASSEQVRQPIYSSSLNLWRHYETHLNELIETLEPILKALPESDWPGQWRQS
ncbi:MAG: sulfotransferase, partial [bacterium]